MNKGHLRNLGITVVFAILCFSCDGSDNCEEGYVQQYGPEGSTFCIPEYEEGLLNDFNLGDSYFHQKHDVIRNENGVWWNQQNRVIDP